MRDKLCGMCFANYSNLKQHLTVSHTIPNREEFQLLMKYGNARTSENLDCEICGKKALVRLDKHLQDSHNMGSAEEREPLMKEAKRAAIVRELAKLRESDPDVPMVSTLDIGIITEHDDYIPPIGEEQFEEPLDEEQKGLELKDEEEEREPLNLKIKKSNSIDPPTGNDFIPRCSTYLPLRNHERNWSSSDPHQSTSQPLPSTPVSGSDDSSSTSLHQLPPLSLPVSKNPPSCESEPPSSVLPGHLSGQSENLTACSDPHQNTSQPLSSPPVPGSHNSFCTPLCQLSSAPLPVSMNPPLCESELPSFNLPGHLSGQTDHLTACNDLHQSTSQPLHSTPVTGSNNSSSTPLYQHPSAPLPVSMNPLSCESELPSPNLPGHLCGQSEHVIGSISKACPCKCDWEQFESRLQLLEQKVDRMMTVQPETPKSIPRKPPLSAQKFEHASKGRKGDPLFEKIVDDFRKFRLGPRTGKKDRDNAQQSRTHALRFCLYMAAGLPSSSISHNLRFLYQMDKLRAFPTYLSQKGYAPTSIKCMLINVIMFFRHIENSFKGPSKLKQIELKNIQYEMKRIQAEVQRKVVVHRQKVLRHKTDNQLDAVEARKFMMTARKRIPKLFEYLARNGPQQNEHSLVMGYIMGYLCNLTGHRSVVLTNMTKESVDNSESWDRGKRFQVLVDDHKTTRSFGQAVLCLNEKEFGWLQHLSKGKCCIQGQGSDYVFHTTLGKQIVKPSNLLHLAWVDSGMKGTVNFTKIRSSVSTQANQHLSEKERKQVARSMCHDPSTAEKFYVALPDKETSYETRKLRIKALQMAVAKPSQEDQNDDEEASLDETPKTSSDSEEPIYDDQPQSSSSPSSEELRIMSEKYGRFQQGDEVNSKCEVSSSSEDELPSAATSKSKRRLNFSHKSKQCGARKKMLQIHVYTPSKCSVVIDKLRQPIEDYFLHKMKATKPLLKQSKSCEESPLDESKNLQASQAKQSVMCMAAPTAEEEPGCDPEPLTGMTTGSVQAPPSGQTPGCVPAPLIPIQQTLDSMQQAPVDQWTTKCIPETAAEQIAETPVEENLQCDPEPSIQHTPNCVPETPLEQMPQAPAEEDPWCFPQPSIQLTPNCVPETPLEQMPQAPAEEDPWCFPQPSIQHTPNCVPETPLEQMPQAPAEEDPWCFPQPSIQHTPNCVPETPLEQMPQAPAEEDPWCFPQPSIQHTPNCVPETPLEQMPQAPAEEDPWCFPQPSIQHTPNCVPETPLEQMPQTPSKEYLGCVPEPLIQQSQ